MTDDAELQAPPAPISPVDLLLPNLPEAWSGEMTTALSIAAALSKRTGQTLPWVCVREAIDGALRARLLERSLDSGNWPCDYPGASNVRLRLPVEHPPPPPPPPPPPRPGVLSAEADLSPTQIQDLAEAVGDLGAAAVGYGLKYRLRIELGGEKPPPPDVASRVNDILKDTLGDVQVK